MKFQNFNLIFVTDAQTEGQAQSNMSLQLVKKLGHQNHFSQLMLSKQPNDYTINDFTRKSYIQSKLSSSRKEEYK